MSKSNASHITNDNSSKEAGPLLPTPLRPPRPLLMPDKPLPPSPRFAPTLLLHRRNKALKESQIRLKAEIAHLRQLLVHYHEVIKATDELVKGTTLVAPTRGIELRGSYVINGSQSFAQACGKKACGCAPGHHTFNKVIPTQYGRIASLTLDQHCNFQGTRSKYTLRRWQHRNAPSGTPAAPNKGLVRKTFKDGLQLVCNEFFKSHSFENALGTQPRHTHPVYDPVATSGILTPKSLSIAMSGAEAAFVVGLISGVISIVEATKTIYDAAKDAKGQPEAFRQVHARLVLVIEILDRARERAQMVDETTQEALEPILESCKAKAENLKKMFQKVIRKDDDKWYDRYKKALGTLGKEYKVECLMEDILKDIQVLVCETLMGTATDAQVREIQEAIKEMTDMPSPLQDETGGVTQNHQGSGNNNANTGRGAQHTGAGDLYHNEIKGDAYFGSNSMNPTFNNYAPPELLETPPTSSIVIPFSRDEDFVERGGLLDQIHQKCAVLGSRTALVGLGGVGKSQLSIEYAYRSRDRLQKTWVFWVHASNTARFEQSFRDIANCVKIAGRQNPKANIFQLVHDWLHDDRKGAWVVILDNVDDASYLVERRSTGQDLQKNNIDDGKLPPLMSYLPHCPNGSILMTTRSREAALELVKPRDIIAIEPMSPKDALALLKNKLGRGDGSDDAAQLVAELDFMPLAIVQAAAYISELAPRSSVRQYLQSFRKSNSKRSSLLKYEAKQLQRDSEAKNSIIITWQISFNHIREIRPSATDLLSLMSFFDWQGIPEALLRSQNVQRSSRQDQNESDGDKHVKRDTDYNDDVNDEDDDEDNTTQSSVSDEFEGDVAALRNYSFISVNADGITFKMHRLVQLATRKWLKAHGQQERWKQQFISNLDAELPTGEYENWVTCQALSPHVQIAATQKPKEQDSLIDWASILYKAAWYAWSMGKGVEAYKMSVQANEVRKRILGREHNDTLNSMTMVGLAYKLRGLWEAAEELEVQVMKTSKEKLGADHPSTLTSMANLASTFWNQGRWDAAEELQVQVMETRKEKLGADHLETLTSMANLASTFWNQGRWEAAEELQVQVMETSKEKLGADHPSTLTSMANLASTFWYQGRWDAAEELQVRVMEMRKEKLGADHPSTLTSMANLASTFRNQGRWDAAEELEVQVMETSKERLGADHPSTLISMNNLAWTWKGQNRDAEALGLISSCLKLLIRKLGAAHPKTLACTQTCNSWKMEEPHVR
ncbi:hypothetical protein V496_01972 [Pseudogymnoascus sp. VKM F-4515 (FW-2607)]|nr:hypothetical protein V496_01972 [Pseudogymnoascus sp. VKM F-4515 (FW-2607)]